MMKVVIVGGGKGQSALIRGIKRIQDIDVATIVSVTDDGGSTGRLRRYYDIPAIGDVRNVISALSKDDSILSDLMMYRFPDDNRSELANHALGNLILTALIDQEGSFMGGIERLASALGIGGHICPSTTDMVTLCARMSDGTIVRGESNIPRYRNHIFEVYYDTEVHASQAALKAIQEADVIVLGVGSLYTSILPNLIIDDIKDAIKARDIPIVYYCNAMTQPGETEKYSVEDHVDAIQSHTGLDIEVVVMASNPMDDATLALYEKSHSEPVVLASNTPPFRVEKHDLIEVCDGVIRHDELRVEASMRKILEGFSCHLVQK